MGVEAALLEEIRADRDEPGHYLAYADLLQAAGDPRGELIVIQHRLVSRPHDRALRRAEQALLRRHAASLLPPSLLAAAGSYRRLDARWRYGFLRRIRIVHEHPRKVALADVLHDLLGHRSAWALDSLTIGPARRDHGALGDAVGSALEVHAPPLRELVLAHRGESIDLPAMLARLPELRRLEIRAGALRTSDQPIVHDRLEALLVTLDSRFDGMRQLAEGCLPRLERLELSAPGLVADRRGVVRILESSCPRLRALALARTRFAERIAEALLTAPALSRLDEVVLRGAVSARAAKTLAGYAADPRFAHLRFREIGA